MLLPLSLGLSARACRPHTKPASQRPPSSQPRTAAWHRAPCQIQSRAATHPTPAAGGGTGVGGESAGLQPSAAADARPLEPSPLRPTSGSACLEHAGQHLLWLAPQHQQAGAAGAEAAARRGAGQGRFEARHVVVAASVRAAADSCAHLASRSARLSSRNWTRFTPILRGWRVGGRVTLAVGDAGWRRLCLPARGSLPPHPHLSGCRNQGSRMNKGHRWSAPRAASSSAGLSCRRRPCGRGRGAAGGGRAGGRGGGAAAREALAPPSCSALAAEFHPRATPGRSPCGTR